MTELKCPFCGEKLVKWMGYADCRFWTCNNVLCEAGRFGHIADECIWQELIRTRKALDVAVNALNFYANKQHYKNEELDLYVYEYEDNNETGILDLDDGGKMENGKKARDALDEITALEQKDVK